jgi:hypothetical protein
MLNRMKIMTSSKTATLVAGVTLTSLLLLAGCDKAAEAPQTSAPASQVPVAQPSASTNEKVQLMHVHGLSYSPDGSKILIPSHLGLAVFDLSSSAWSVAPGPAHDYMGFSATKDAIYSSGHPAVGSGFVNPFGVIKSSDGGQTWKKLGFEGESDFHLLATGYETNAVYVVNPHPNSKMKEEGIYYTLNDGFAWQEAPARGLEGNPMSIAVHPSDPKTIAVGTGSGLYFSQDAGSTFQKLEEGKVAAVFFDLNGNHLWFSSVDGNPELVRFNLDSKEAASVTLPAMVEDAVSYIAQNPAKQDEYAIATFKRSVYVSRDEGKTWKQIAENGQSL